jgi:hypothetical protein
VLGFLVGCEAQQGLREQVEREPARFLDREAPVLLAAARKERFEELLGFSPDPESAWSEHPGLPSRS